MLINKIRRDRKIKKNNMNNKKKIIWWSVVSVIVIVACVLIFGKKSSKSVMTFKMEAVKRGNVNNTVTATGTIEPVVKVEVGTQVSGIVKKLYVDYNSVVKKGQVIAELDKTTLMADYESQKSSYAKAQSDYSYQLKNYNREKMLHDKGLVADSEYESALDSYQSSKNTLAMSRQGMEKARTNLSYATITSPIDGVVLSKSVEEGQTVAASFSTPTLFYIAKDLTQMRVIADVDEADIGNVKDGQRVEFTVDAYVGETFSGTVTQVRQNATTTNNVVTYEVVVSAPNPDLKLKPGLTANITIYTAEKNNVLTVKPKALKFDPQLYAKKNGYSISKESQQYLGNHTVGEAEKGILWTLNNKTFTAIPVETGTKSKTAVEITSGVQEGTKVVVEMSMSSTAGTTLSDSDSSSSSDQSSPFMPKHPGENNKKSSSNGGENSSGPK